MLFAPAAALPALLPRLLVGLLVALPVVPVDGLVVVPLIDDPGAVVVPDAPGLAAVPPPAVPALPWASANVLVSAIAAAKPIVASFMITSFVLLRRRDKGGWWEMFLS